MEVSIPKSIRKIIFILTLFLSACASEENKIEKLSQSYEQDREYESLVALMPHLNYEMTRSNVEGLLGEEMICVVPDSCTYFSNRMVVVSCPDGVMVDDNLCQRFPLALIVRYDLADEKIASPQDTLSGFSLSPVGE